MGPVFVVICSVLIAAIVLFFVFVLSWSLWVSIIIGFVLGIFPGLLISGFIVAIILKLLKKECPGTNLLEGIIMPTLITSVLICLMVPIFQQAKRKQERLQVKQASPVPRDGGQATAKGRTR
jgi:LytS/YehU family sensor histidine kinase